MTNYQVHSKICDLAKRRSDLFVIFTYPTFHTSGYLKNNDIKDDFTVKGITEARKLWRIDTLPEEEQKSYSRYLKGLRNEASRILTLKIDAEDSVRLDEERQFVRNFRENNVGIGVIINFTGLTREEILEFNEIGESLNFLYSYMLGFIIKKTEYHIIIF